MKKIIIGLLSLVFMLVVVKTALAYSFTHAQDVNDGTVGQLVVDVAEDGDWMVWTFDFPVELFTGDGNLNVGLIIATDGEGEGPAFQIHNTDSNEMTYTPGGTLVPAGTWVMSPWGPTTGDGWMGWHSSDTNTPVTSLSWVDATGDRVQTGGTDDGVLQVKILKSELGESFHWAANPTVGSGFWGSAYDDTMQMPVLFGWGTPLVNMSAPNYFYAYVGLPPVIRYAEITNPLAGNTVSGFVNFTAFLTDDDPDNIQWAVRKDSCVANPANNVFGNVGGLTDTADIDQLDLANQTFSFQGDMSTMNSGNYCFIYNPVDDSDESDLRATVEFNLIKATPTDKNECKKGGWESFTNPMFKNQGACVSYVVSNENAGKETKTLYQNIIDILLNR